MHNFSNKKFAENEIQLRNKGFIHTLRLKPNHWLKTIALEAKNAISYSNDEKNYLRRTV
jgi:hypothetical protein